MYTQFFGNYLLSNGYVTKEQLFSAMKRESSQRLKLGTLAMLSGYMTATQIDEIVIMQTHQDRKFGELAVELGYLTKEQLDELLSLQTPAYLALGQSLLDDGVITNADFEKIMEDYRSKNSLDETGASSEEQEVISQMFDKFFSDFNKELSDKGHVFIKLLFNNFVRFIGNDFTPHESEEATEASVECCVKQSIIGDYAINTYLSMPKSAAVVFASRYVGDTFEEYDEYVQASLEDFLNLHNDLFVANLSGNDSSDLDLMPPEPTDTSLTFSGRAVHISILYSFGTIDFYMELATK